MAKRTSDREENMTPYNRRLGRNATWGHVSDTSRLPKQPNSQHGRAVHWLRFCPIDGRARAIPKVARSSFARQRLVNRQQ